MVVRGKKINKERLEQIIEKNCNDFKICSKQEKEDYTEYIYNIDISKKNIIKLKEKILDGIDADFVKFI